MTSPPTTLDELEAARRYEPAAAGAPHGLSADEVTAARRTGTDLARYRRPEVRPPEPRWRPEHRRCPRGPAPVRWGGRLMAAARMETVEEVEEPTIDELRARAAECSSRSRPATASWTGRSASGCPPIGRPPASARPTGGGYRLAEVPPRPSLVFPPGTTYLEALRELLVAVVERGEMPGGARLGPPLPSGVVLLQDRSRGLSLDLRAPFGYDPATGQVSGTTTLPLTGISASALETRVRAGAAGRPPGGCPGSGPRAAEDGP